MLSYISSYFWYALGYTDNSNEIEEKEIENLKEKVNNLEKVVEDLKNKKSTKRDRKIKKTAKQKREIYNKNFKKLSDNQIRRLASNKVYDLEIINHGVALTAP